MKKFVILALGIYLFVSYDFVSGQNDCSGFPFKYGCSSYRIRELQLCLGLHRENQTGTYDEMTQTALLNARFDMSQGITKNIYDAVLSHCHDISNTTSNYKSSSIQDKRIIRDPTPRKDIANVFYQTQYTLFDFLTDEPIFPDSNGLYNIYYATNEDKNPKQLNVHSKDLPDQHVYKFKNYENCQKWCNNTSKSSSENQKNAVNNNYDIGEQSNESRVSDASQVTIDRIDYPNGSYYYGQIQNGKPNGTGKLYVDGKVQKEGLWQDAYYIGNNSNKQSTQNKQNNQIDQEIIGQTVQDVNKNTYKIVSIGKQIWFAENLRVRSYSNGDPIPYFEDNKETYPQKGVYVQFSIDNSRAYNWYAVSDERGLCPVGWRVPSESDWDELVSYLGSGAEIKLKSKTGWGSRTETSGGFYEHVPCPNCIDWNMEYRSKVPCNVCKDTRWVNGRYIPKKEEFVNYNGNNSSGFNATPFAGLSLQIYGQLNIHTLDQCGYWSSTISTKSGTTNSYGYTEAIEFFEGGSTFTITERIDSFLGVRCLKNE